MPEDILFQIVVKVRIKTTVIKSNITQSNPWHDGPKYSQATIFVQDTRRYSGSFDAFIKWIVQSQARTKETSECFLKEKDTAEIIFTSNLF